MFISSRVKLTPVFCPCSQIITLSTQSVMHSGHDGEWRFPTRPTYAQASQIQSKALSAVSVLLLHFTLYTMSFAKMCNCFCVLPSICSLPCFSHPHDTLASPSFLFSQRSPVVRGSTSTCSRSSARSALLAPTRWAPAWPLTSGTACHLVLLPKG